MSDGLVQRIWQGDTFSPSRALNKSIHGFIQSFFNIQWLGLAFIYYLHNSILVEVNHEMAGKFVHQDHSNAPMP